MTCWDGMLECGLPRQLRGTCDVALFPGEQSGRKLVVL
jgi:hypothetical protein